MSLLVIALIKATVVLAGALFVSRLLRHQSAAARHLVWTCALVAALLLPVVSYAVPPLEVPLVEVSPPTRLDPPPIQPDGSLDRQVPVMESRRRTLERPAATGERGARRTPLTSVVALSWTTLAITVWLIGALLLLGRLLVGLIAVRRLAQQAQRGDAPTWLPLARHLASDMRLENVVFLSGERGTMPMAAGVLRPVVMLPADAETWPEARLRVVLLHELAHVKRADCLTHMLAQAACAIHWINPLAWVAVRQARIERERACDDLVLACGTSNVHYADQLLEIARAMRATRFSPAMSSASLAMAHRSQLEGRLMAILDRSVPRTPLSRARTIAASLLAFAVIVPLASVQPWASSVVPQTPRAPQTNPAVRSEAVSGITDAVVQGVVHALAGATREAVVASVPNAIEDALQQSSGQTNPNPNPRARRDDDDQARPADPKIIAALMTALKDSDEDVRETAMHALLRLRAPNMFEPLLAALKDGSPGVREHAAFGLGQLRDTRALPHLTAALRDQSEDVREQAAFALGQLGDASALDALTAALKDTSAEVRRQAAFAIGQLAK